jgi:hypothetical protein
MQINPLEAVETLKGSGLDGVDFVPGQVQLGQGGQAVKRSGPNGLNFVASEAEAH